MEPLGDELRRELQALGPNAAMAETVAAWPEAVGAEIARNAWPARFRRDGTLIVHAKDAIWAFELGHRAAQISERLPGAPPLTFVPGPLPEPATRDELLDALAGSVAHAAGRVGHDRRLAGEGALPLPTRQGRERRTPAQ